MSRRSSKDWLTSVETPRVRWYHRLNFRLAVVVAGLLILTAVLVPWLERTSSRWFVRDSVLVVDSQDDLVSGVRQKIEPRVLGDLELVAGALLTNARRAGAGRWMPDPAAAAALDWDLHVQGQALAWCAVDGEVLFATEGLDLAPGDVADLSPAGLAAASKRPIHNVGARITVPIHRGGEHAGWLLLSAAPDCGVGCVHASSTPPADWHGGAVVAVEDGAAAAPPSLTDGAGRVVEEDELERWHARVDLILGPLRVLLMVGSAFLVGWLVSQRVTRRLRRMVDVLQRPVDPDSVLPGPFDVSHEDEISALALTMNRMRDRIRGLVEHLVKVDVDRRDWVAQVSHDLRTPLTALSACIQRAEVEAREIEDGPARERMLEVLSVAKIDADRMRTLTEDLLDIARLDAMDQLAREPVPPGELARQAIKELRVLAETRGVLLSVDVEPGLPILEADGRRLMRGLENLLRNALHHSHATAVVRVDRRGETIRFDVRDDGPGLPVDEHGVVDIRSLAAVRSRDDSAGLGLVVTRKVAEAHGGRVGASNLEEGGASVWFEVPVVAA